MKPVLGKDENPDSNPGELSPLKYGTEESVVVTNMRTFDAADHVLTDIGRFREFVFGDEQDLDTGGVDGEPPR